VAITLGKDATISVDGAVVGVRNVQFSSNARTIDIEEYGSRFVSVYQTGRDGVVSMEINDDQSIGNLVGKLQSGDEVTVGGGKASWSFPAVITNISESAAVDGVVTFQVEARLTKSGLR
jgi:inner membrane protein involved in colicin E2 resistance